MATENQNMYRQVYNAREDEHLLSWTDHVVCIMMRRGVMAAAFNSSGEILSMHYTAYGKDRAVWSLDFFEQLFAQEPLLMKKDKITSIFFCSEQNVIIPSALYDAAEADKWLKQVHFLEPTDCVEHYHLKQDNAHYVYAIPVQMRELVKINCPNARFAPLAAYQLAPRNHFTMLQCCITAEQACVTFHHKNELLWHKIFDISAADDIAFEIAALCSEHKLTADKQTLHCNAISATEYSVANDLSQYFSRIVAGNGTTIDGLWHPALSLMKQLETCVL